MSNFTDTPAGDIPDRTHRVAVLRGDGIGPEVIAEAQATLELAASLGGFDICTEQLRGRERPLLATGSPMAQDTPDRLAGFDAILFGPFGDPRVPDNVLLWGTILGLRQRFDQFVNVRPGGPAAGRPGRTSAPECSMSW